MALYMNPGNSLTNFPEKDRMKAWVTYATATELLAPLAWYAVTGKTGSDIGLGEWLIGHERRRVMYARHLIRQYYWILATGK